METHLTLWIMPIKSSTGLRHIVSLSIFLLKICILNILELLVCLKESACVNILVYKT